jgi:hypothetical protein
MSSRGRSVNAVGVRRRLLVLPSEISTGVPDAPSVWFAGWWGTAASVAALAVEKSAEAKVPAGSMVAGKGRT